MIPARAFALILLLVTGLFASAEPPAAAWPLRPMMTLPITSQRYCLNVSGDCVQDSNTMVGLQQCDVSQYTLLWDTEYGPHERGGSGPDRVAAYCRQRGVEIYNVTGRSFADTSPWIDWSAQTGRFAAVGCFSRHFQTLYGRDFERDLYYIQNNWDGTFGKPYEYTRRQFKAEHEASGAWVVIPKMPPAALNPIYTDWWNRPKNRNAIAVAKGPQYLHSLRDFK